MALTKDLGVEPVVRDAKNIAYENTDGYRARGIIPLDHDGNQSGIRTNPLFITTGSESAFGETLVAELTPVFQQSFEYTISSTHLSENTVANNGTVTQSDGMAICTSSATAGGTAQLSSGPHAKYTAGQGGLIRFTALFSDGVASTVQYVGILDEVGSSASYKNGFAIGFDGTTFGAHRFQNDVKITVALANCDDPLDGTGESGMTYDHTKLNVFEIRFQYLGSGKIEYCIEDDSTGLFVVFHTVLYANNNIVPSVYMPNFHFIMLADNIATATSLIVKVGSFGYFVEGKARLSHLQQPQFSSTLQTVTGVQAEAAIFTIRNKALYASKTNFIDLQMEQLVCSIEAGAANNLGSIRLVKNATLGGTPSYADINTTDSVVDIDIAGTTVTGGSEMMVVPLAGKNDKEILDLTPFTILMKHGETLTVSGISVASATINASLLWKELF